MEKSPGSPPAGRQAGIILILITGIVFLLLLLGLAFLQMGFVSGRISGGRAAQAAATLAADSGMEYAAARLRANPDARYSPAPDDRGDDWAFREDARTDLGQAQNPSYSHGESWWKNASTRPDGADNDGNDQTDEFGETDRIYVPGEDGFPAECDRDADGRFSAYSGRLRAGAAGAGLPAFSLKIECEDGKIPLNAGSLDGGDIGGGTTYGANNVPDCRDVRTWGVPAIPNTPGIPYHNGLAHVLNNLGVVCGLTTRREDVGGGGGEPIQISWLGHDLLSKRPVGGYKSWEQVEQTLMDAALPPAARYQQWELDAVKPFVSLGPYDSPAESGRVPHNARRDFPAYAPISLRAASPEVLKSVWRYLNGWIGDYPYGPPGWPAGWTTVDYSRLPSPNTRTFAEWNPIGGWVTYYTRPLIFPDDADRLAGRVLSWRAKGTPSWQKLYTMITQNAESIFLRDTFDYAPDANANNLPDDPVSDPENLQSWLQVKADIAFRAVSMDPFPYAGVQMGCAAWAGWSIDRPGPYNFPASFVAYHHYNANKEVYGIHRAESPAYYQEPSPWGGDPLYPYKKVSDRAYFRAQGFTLRPPSRFRIESLGAARPSGGARARIEGELSAAETLEFTSQEDFENLVGGTNLAKRGITVVNDPAAQARRAMRPEASPEPRADYPHIVSHPRIDRRSHTAAVEGSPGQGFSRQYGALTLGGKQNGLGGEGGAYTEAKLYVPFVDDWNPAAGPVTEGAGGAYPYNMTWFFPVCEDKYTTNPLVRSTPSILMNNFQCPGLDGAGFSGFSFEFWMSPPGFFFIKNYDNGSNFLQLQASRVDGPPETPNTLFQLTTDWLPANAWLSVPFCMIDDDNTAGRLSWFYHVVLVFAPAGAKTEVRLYINGKDDPNGSGIPLVQTLNQTMTVTGNEYTGSQNIGEIRFYDKPLTGADADRLYHYERFVRDGTYTSPLYRFDGDACLDRVQWTGIIPQHFLRAADLADPVHSLPSAIPLDPFTVEVHGYLKPDGTQPAPASPVTLSASGAVDPLSSMGPVKSFRYKVRMNCTELAGPLTDTPVFESIWFTLLREGRTPAWTSWRAR